MLNLLYMAIEWNRTLKALLLYVVGFILIIAVIVLVYELVSKKEEYIFTKNKTHRLLNNDQKDSKETINKDKQEVVVLSINKKQEIAENKSETLILSIPKNKTLISVDEKVKFALLKNHNVLLKCVEDDQNIKISLSKDKYLISKSENENLLKLSLKRKKNKIMIKSIIVLLCVCILSIFGVTFSKYVSSQNENPSADLAEFIEIDKDDYVTALDLKDCIINPNSDTVNRRFYVHNNGETQVLCRFTVNTTGNLPLIYSWSILYENSFVNSLVYEKVLDINEKKTFVLSILWDESFKSFVYSYDLDYISISLSCEQYSGG